MNWAVAAVGILAAFALLVFLLMRQTGKRAVAEDDKAEANETLQIERKQSDIIAERRSDDDVSNRLRRGDF
jgi:hypothetical protein